MGVQTGARPIWRTERRGGVMTAGSATQRIEPQPWMTAPETRAVIAALTAAGAEVRFVGGCVRDALAGRAVKDVDIATPDRPEQVIALLEAAGLKAVPRSEERRVGKEGGRTCRSRWAPYH